MTTEDEKDLVVPPSHTEVNVTFVVTLEGKTPEEFLEALDRLIKRDFSKVDFRWEKNTKT